MGKAAVGDPPSSPSLQTPNIFIHFGGLCMCVCSINIRSVERGERVLPSNGGHPLILITCPGFK